jgi:hypothetical protein
MASQQRVNRRHGRYGVSRVFHRHNPWLPGWLVRPPNNAQNFNLSDYIWWRCECLNARILQLSSISNDLWLRDRNFWDNRDNVCCWGVTDEVTGMVFCLAQCVLLRWDDIYSCSWIGVSSRATSGILACSTCDLSCPGTHLVYSDVVICVGKPTILSYLRRSSKGHNNLKPNCNS